MNGLEEHQQVRTVGSSRPGSSGSSGSSSSSEWGSCSELLLVSAVKKHGIPNWNLVASELKARAILLDISPSCFTEEACKFKYNALKGKFASSSSSCGGGSVSSPSDDLDGGMSWFEELRKSRMSHLKEELRVYDTSIGQLQSRINQLQEERALQEEKAHCPSPRSGMKQQVEANCRADGPPPSKGYMWKASTPTCPSEDSFEMARDSTLPYAAGGASRAGNIAVTSTDLDQQESCVRVAEEPESRRDRPATSSPQFGGQESTGGADVTLKQSMPSGFPTPEETPEKVVDKGEEQVFSAVSTLALRVVEDEIGKGEPDLEIPRPISDVAVVDDNAVVENQSKTKDESVEEEATEGDRAVEENSSDVAFRDGDAQVRGEGFDTTIADENDTMAGLEERGARKDSEPEIAVSIPCPPPELPSSPITVVDIAEDSPPRHSFDSPEALAVASGASSPSRVSELEASNSRGSLEIDSIGKREFRFSRLSLSYGRAAKEKRLKAKEEAKLKEMLRSELSQGETLQPSKSTTEETDVREFQEKVVNASSIPLKQSDTGRNAPDRFSMDEGNAEFVKEDVVEPYPITLAVGDCADNGYQLNRLDDGSHLRNSMDADVWLSDADVDARPPSLDLVSRKRAEPSSPEDEIPLLTVALGPDPELAEQLHSNVVSEIERGKEEVSTTLESSPHPETEDEVVEEAILNEATEMPIEVKAASSNLVHPQAQVMSEEVEVPQEVNYLMTESEIASAGQDEEAKLDVVDMVIKCDEGEALETDLGTLRSDDVTEALQTKGSENCQEESRDGPETGEGQQSFPEYTDSQIDKSEVGSSMDSVEDMSPSSRKNRREPKVPGKFLPLLECLRVICANKFAPLFKQRQDYQDNARYDRLVRRHVDLSMVRSRLEDGAYSGSVEFFRDLLLIFTNALVYNSSDSQEYVGAKALRSCALTEMDKISQTEALLKRNGPATRKREVKKSFQVHKARVSSNSAGSEVRKKGILKGSTDSPAALDSQGGAKSAHIAFEDTPYGGRSSNHNDIDRDLDAKLETTFRKAVANRAVREEIPRKESQKAEVLFESGNRGSGGSSGKKMKPDRDFHKSGLQGQFLADLRASGIENKATLAKMKDVICIDMEEKGTHNLSSSVVSSGLSVEKQRTPPILRQASTSRISRYSKRGGNSTASNPKKRVRND